jgi:hypothetical protein
VQQRHYEFKVEGETLIGTATGGPKGQEHKPAQIKEGKVKGDEGSFVETIKIMDMDVGIKYKGKLASDEIKFKREVGSFATEGFVARRVADRKATDK